MKPLESNGSLLRVESIPERLRNAAERWYASMPARDHEPALYVEQSAWTGRSDCVARRRVRKLCAYYETQIGAPPGGRLPGEVLKFEVAQRLISRNTSAMPRLFEHVRNEPGARP